MSDKPSPFAGLDKALLRSTKSPEVAAPVQDTHAPPAGEGLRDEATVEASPARKPRAAARQIHTTKATKESKQDSMIASKQDSMLANQDAEMIARVRKAVRIPGKEVSFVRLTAEEKQQLADI